MKRLIQLFILILAMGLPVMASATHIRSVDIKVQPICSGAGLTYEIIVIAYLDNTHGRHAGGNATLDFGDGTFVNNMSAEFKPLNVSGLDSDVSVYQYKTTHTYSGSGTYRVSYRESHRNIDLVNIANAADDVDYITFLEFTVNENYKCNRIPVLTVPPLDKACSQVTFYHSSGAFDEDRDSLSYELTIPFKSRTQQAPYSSPITNTFYGSLFNVGNEADTGPPTFSIDAISGLLTWDAPGQTGQYNIAFNIIEWRKDPATGTYTKLSTTTRDMQIIVESCPNNKPQLIVPQDICVVAGTVIDQSIFGTDPDSDSVKIEVFGQLVEFNASQLPASYTPNPAKFQKPKATLQFHWQTDCMHVSSQPYQVVFKITDKPNPGVKLVNFKIWNIKVIAPPPVLQQAQLDIVKSKSILDWSDYTCANANSMQVWRKVGPYDYTPGTCDVGIPRSTGYNLIATVPINQKQFVDDNAGLGLSPGAIYCYRLVAYFDAPASASSIVSNEVCIGPVKADAPIITHVSVEQTDLVDGAIRVSWRKPMRINKAQFPPNTYEYEVYRADDFIGEANITKAGRVSDTTYLDRTLNTEENVFNYRIVLYAQPPLATEKIAVDTSAVASSERLAPTPGIGLISLAWRDSVPWSNVVQEKPYHLIYRGVDDNDPANMILYDSINVAENSFRYIDDGPLEDDKEYSYRILTRGTYGNDTIPLQENFSQVVSVYTNSNLLPCSPLVSIDKIDCDKYLTGANCNETVFANTLRWSVSGLSNCRKNIDHFKIYVSTAADGEFVFLTTATDTFHIDGGLPSFVRCYKISAVDKKGLESALSDATCNDNCPYFTLPNVFTPGSADGFNDTFNANFDNAVTASPEEVIIRCPRFVEAVDFVVYNRWGEQVYHTSTLHGGSNNIEWPGIDAKGRELSNGIYYYTAEVRFNVSDPQKRIKEYRGWVKLVR